MKARAAVLIALGLAVVIVIVAVILGQLPGNSAHQQAAISTSTVPRSSATAGSSAGQEGHSQTQTAKPFSLPPSSPQAKSPASAPLISAPLPKTASARGRIVAGFPTAVVPPVPESTVLFSSVASQGKRVQVGLEGSSSMTTRSLLDYYRAQLGSLGLRSADAPAAPGAQALAFTRGADTVTVTVSASKQNSSYAVFGVFVAGS